MVDVATKRVRQLTDGVAYEHSIDWSPNGDEIVYVSDPSPNADQFFNYDIFAIKVSDGSVRRNYSDGKCGVFAEVVARWKNDCVFRDEARADGSRNDDGGYACLGGEC